MNELYFVSGDVSSETARMLIRRKGLEVKIHRVEQETMAEVMKTKGIFKFPCLIIDDIRYVGLDEIRKYPPLITKVEVKGRPA